MILLTLASVIMHKHFMCTYMWKMFVYMHKKDKRLSAVANFSATFVLHMLFVIYVAIA